VLRDAFTTRHFRIWAICLLLFVIVSACIVVRLVRQPSEPFVSVKPVRSSTQRTSEPFDSVKPVSSTILWTDTPATVIFLSNKMSFTVNCRIVAEGLRSEKWVPLTSILFTSVDAHSQKVAAIVYEPRFNPIGAIGPSRLSVSYGRQLKPLELSVLNKIPWLKKHYPFNRRRLFTIYEPVSDVHVSSESK